MKNTVHLCDCVDFMRGIPDKAYDLAIVDPPYGIKINMNQGRRKNDTKKHEYKKWDSETPDKNYFQEITRVSKRQIIWGANNFGLKSNGWLIWDKDISGAVDFSKCELAYTSFLNHIEIIKIRAQTGKETYSEKIHPTQKPVALYKWLLKNYAKPGQTIFDSHVGSGSIRIACHDLGFDFEGCELDPDYHSAQEKRYHEHIAQGELFDKHEIQEKIFEKQLFT